MDCELDAQLGYEKRRRVSDPVVEMTEKNYRNGYSKKTAKTQLSEVELKIPRDRNGEFETQIISKYSRNVDGMEEKIIGLYACGMSQRDIADQIKALMSDLKLVYQAVTEEEAFANLARFKETWGKQYPSCARSWEENWDILSPFFAYPAEIRKIIYTANLIEGLNRQFRKVTKNKPSFTNDDSLRKMLYLASKTLPRIGTALAEIGMWCQIICGFYSRKTRLVQLLLR